MRHSPTTQGYHARELELSDPLFSNNRSSRLFSPFLMQRRTHLIDTMRPDNIDVIASEKGILDSPHALPFVDDSPPCSP